jgi:tRNA (adenine37-N6)-methyltransferase
MAMANSLRVVDTGACRLVAVDNRFVHIGSVRSPFTSLAGMPLQTVAAAGVAGTVELEEEFAPALRDLAAFSHAWLLCDLHRSSGFEVEVVPYLDDQPRSLFATRSPRRPSPIGLSLVRVVGVEGPVLHVEELDLLDGTPVLDIKPYVPLFDARETTRIGWFGEAAARVFDVQSDARYEPPGE